MVYASSIVVNAVYAYDAGRAEGTRTRARPGDSGRSRRAWEWWDANPRAGRRVSSWIYHQIALDCAQLHQKTEKKRERKEKFAAVCLHAATPRSTCPGSGSGKAYK